MLKRFREEDVLGKPLTEKQEQEIASAESRPDEDIDTSDIPEVRQLPADAIRAKDFQAFRVKRHEATLASSHPPLY